MTYESILKELEEQDLKNEFCLTFEPFLSESFLYRLRNTNKIHSVGSLIRTVLPYVKDKNNVWNRWVLILQWYMHPEFARPNKITDWIIQKQ